MAPPGEVTRSLVPDVAYLSHDRLGFCEDRPAQIPYMAPTVAFEVLSPNDRSSDVNEKIRAYLARGTELVVIIDPQVRTVELHDRSRGQKLDDNATFVHPALPEFALAVAAIFAKPGERP